MLALCPRVAHSQNHSLGSKKGEASIFLTLDQAINLALKANRSIRGSAYNLESQKLSLDSVRSAFDLKVTPATKAGITDDEEAFGAGVSFKKKLTSGPEVSLSPAFGIAEEAYTGAVGVSLDIPLFRGFGKDVNLDSIYSSQYSLRNAERSLYLSQVNIVLETVSAVYDIIKQQGLVQLSNSQLQNLKGYAETARIKERVGLATPMDIYRAEISLKDAEGSLALARQALQAAQDRLKIILALPLETALSVNAPMECEPVHITVQEAIRTALTNRIELKQAQDAIQEAQRKAALAKHNILPNLDLEMGYERFGSSGEFDQSWGFDERIWSINLVASTDWARTSERASYQQSLINVRNTRLAYTTKEDEIEREVRDQLEALANADERITIRDEQIQQAKGKLELSKIKFRHHMADNFDIIEAETELQQARTNLLAVKTDYIVGTYRMRAVLGTLIEG
ncbi:MAG: TolC family protein [Dissulfuribacterales bacterium]